jgi:hypothetical protein
VSRLKFISERTHVRCYENHGDNFSGAADGRGSSGSSRHRWCLQKRFNSFHISRFPPLDDYG